jgi:hypothetical protein
MERLDRPATGREADRMAQAISAALILRGACAALFTAAQGLPARQAAGHMTTMEAPQAVAAAMAAWLTGRAGPGRIAASL